MISALALLCILAPAVLGEESTSYYQVLHDYDGTLSPFNIPADKAEIENRGWEEVEMPSNIPEKYRTGSTMYGNTRGHTLCEIVNEAGKVIGFQFAMDQELLSDNAFDAVTQGYYEWKNTINGTEKTYWAYFVGCDDDAVEINGINGELMTLSKVVSENTEFTAQKCVDGKGHHNFWKMNSALAKDAANLLPLYMLSDNSGKLIGFGCYMAAKYTVSEGLWTWSINWPSTITQEVLSDYPSWMDDMGSSPGYTGIEVYLEDIASFTCA